MCAVAAQLHVTRRPWAASVEEREALNMTVVVGGRRLPLGGGEVELWTGADPQPMRRLPRAPIEFAARLERRGAHVIGPSIVRYRDPFGICSRAVCSPESHVLVLPRIERVRAAQLARLLALARGNAGRRARGDAGIDVDGLAPYRLGAPASRIHWPTVARTGTLFERRLHGDTDQPPLIALDARNPASVEALDAAVRAAASLCVGLARLGGCWLLLPGEHRARRVEPNLGMWPALHARLALLRPGGELMRAPVERAEVVLWVSASATPGMPLGLDAGAYCTVTPFPRENQPVLFSVAGCAVQARARSFAASTA
jgi:uncharacterized protein (DUF58 family)